MKSSSRPQQNNEASPQQPHVGHPSTPATIGGDPRTDQKFDGIGSGQPMGIAQQHGIGGGNQQLGGDEVPTSLR